MRAGRTVWSAVVSLLLLTSCSGGSEPDSSSAPTLAVPAATSMEPASGDVGPGTELIVPGDLAEPQGPVTTNGSAESNTPQDEPPASDVGSEMGSAAPTAELSSVLAPRLVPSEADFVDPVTVTTQWFAVWCWQPATGLANQNIASAAQWTTDGGHQSDVASAVTDEQWASVVASGMSARCDDVVARVATAAPTADGAVWMLVEGTQVWTDADGQTVREQMVSQTRQALQDESGRWLVDVGVLAG